MKHFRPLFLSQIDLRLPGIHLRRLRLNRHLVETALRPHAHDYAQILLYLGGRGQQQTFRGREVDENWIGTGSTVFLPAGTRHAFSCAESRRPVCLVIDLEWRGTGTPLPRFARLNQAALSETRQWLAELNRVERRSPRAAGVILLILDHLARALRLLPETVGRTASTTPIARAAQRALEAMPQSSRLGEIAARAGYQRDYLNRALKSATGLTLGQMRSQSRTREAQRLLRQLRKVSDVAARLGFEDANYFSRWFRLQTGASPSQWKRGR